MQRLNRYLLFGEKIYLIFLLPLLVATGVRVQREKREALGLTIIKLTTGTPNK